MKKLQIILAIATALFFAGCAATGEKKADDGGSAPAAEKPEIVFSVDGKENKFEPSGSWAYHTAKSYSKKDDKFTTASTTIYLANVEIDGSGGFNTANKPLDKEGQYRVSFGFSGEKGTDEKTPIKVGDYVAKSESFEPNKLDWVKIYHVAQGKESEVELDDKSWKGKATISGIDGTNVAGSIDITDGKNTVKGTFSAKGDKSVK